MVLRYNAYLSTFHTQPKLYFTESLKKSSVVPRYTKTERRSTLHADFRHTLRCSKQLSSEKNYKHTKKEPFL